MDKEKGFLFDPEFSEYNPIFAELENLKRNVVKKEGGGFLASLIKKLSTSIVVPLN